MHCHTSFRAVLAKEIFLLVKWAASGVINYIFRLTIPVLLLAILFKSKNVQLFTREKGESNRFLALGWKTKTPDTLKYRAF